MTPEAPDSPADARPAGPTFAVAFGGGGARGLVHIHVMEALDELGIRPVALSGTSIGAIMGAAFSAGMSGKDIEAYARGILMRRAEVMSRIWSMRPVSLSQMVGGFGITQFNLERILQAFLPQDVPETFEELKIPLQVTATDFYEHCETVFSQGELRFAIAASAALPAVFAPVVRNGHTYIDGGMCNPVPFDLLRGKADIVIAVDVVGAPEAVPDRKPGSVDLMLGSSQLLMQSIIEHKIERCPPDIMLCPPVSGFRVLDFLKIDTLLAETASIKEELKRDIERAVKAKEAA